MRVAFALYDSFATSQFGGNVAGVVILDQALPANTMQQIAAELGASTTGFAVLGDLVAIRYFTPTQEIPACGHVTLAIATDLAERGTWRATPEGIDTIAETQAGKLKVRLMRDECGVNVQMTYRQLAESHEKIRRGDVEDCLGGAKSDPRAPLEIVSTGLRHLIVPFRDTEALRSLNPSWTKVVDVAHQMGFDTLCVYAPVSDGSAVRMRDICAPIGALEEPASGTTSAALGFYVHRHAKWLKPWPMVIAQGVEMGRPSTIEVSIARDPEGFFAQVSGRAIQTVSGSIVID